MIPWEHKIPTIRGVPIAFMLVAAKIFLFYFQHKSEAISALKEAIMMAQESNDHLCLQHALTWLFRVQPENQHLLMQRCISKCNALGLSYLTSLGMIF